MDLYSQRVLVTGGSGFLGSFVCERLHREGVPEIMVPLSQDYDLTQESEVKNMYKDFEPSIVFHLAANVGGIGINRKRAGDFFYRNIRMGLNVIEGARQHNVEKVIAINTSCAYPSDLTVPFREEEFWEGYPEPTNAPYGMAKKIMVVQSRAYKRQYDSPLVVNLIPANMFGPRDNFDFEKSHVIAAMVRRFLEASESGDREVTFWGTGTPTRDFLYVKDAAEAIVKAGQKYNSVKPVNIASGSETTISSLAETIKQLTGYKGDYSWNDNYPDGRDRVCLDPSRAKKTFNFEVSTPLRKGLKSTVRWFQDNRNKVISSPEDSGFRDDLPEYIRTGP